MEKESKRTFHELPEHPVCDNCGKLCINGYGCVTDQDGLVSKVFCRVCDDIKRRQQYFKTKEITSHLMLNATLYGYDRENKGREKDDPVLEEIWKAITGLQEQINSFTKEVWHSGMCEEESRVNHWGKSTTYGDTYQFLTMHTGGRVLFTFQNKDGCHITLIAASGSCDRTVGLQGLFATKELAKDLLSSFISEWKKGKLSLKDDTVSVF